MAQQKLAAVTTELIASYGNTARNVINAYRLGNERAVVFMDQRFVSALDKAGPRLSEKTRDNALAAEKKLAGYYVRGVELTTDNASIAVSKAVELAGKGVQQVAANAGLFEKATGVTTLSTLANAAMPAAQAVNKVVAQIEARSSALAVKMAGKPAKPAKTAAAKRPTAKKTVRARKTA
jgi:hypothetical protein